MLFPFRELTVCIIEKLSNEVYQFDGFSFCNSLERPNYWQQHSHPEIQIAIPQTSAKAWINMRSSATKQYKKQIEPGQSFLVSSNQTHALEWQQTAELTLFYLHPKFFSNAIGELIEENNLVIYERCSLVNDTLICEIATILGYLSKSDSAYIEKLYIENLANLLAIHLLKNYIDYKVKVFDNLSRLSSKKLKAIYDYVESNLESKITLSELATIAGVGKYYFCRLFKGSTNTTPYSYVLHRRIERAKKLLKDSDLSICNIALECGFSNQSHLAKHFRNILGTSPMRYRQSNTEFASNKWY